jgi:hypothetical protein
VIVLANNGNLSLRSVARLRRHNSKRPPTAAADFLIGAGFCFGLPDPRQVGPYSGDEKPLTGEIFCQLSNLRAFLGYLQKQQGAFLTLAGDTHFAPPNRTTEFTQNLHLGPNCHNAQKGATSKLKGTGEPETKEAANRGGLDLELGAD